MPTTVPRDVVLTRGVPEMGRNVEESPSALAPHVVKGGMDWGVLFLALVQSAPQRGVAGSGWGCRGRGGGSASGGLSGE